ncbi:GntR family transcriptional regulator [Sinorhizobium meliloti]|nr:GntR family transcriptional regulator [Sinorhizobium meliloti]MDW9435367.1 GntR family transcriptional regulator [Sinorhizobium meliloti]MDW9480897.1 GntR family transcriptional regulator [Sinorhizobium meliloti]MDW9506279.1 GntR family transcriptional regulator [Sinorhizobium meliloti]MDW9593431.1 GntR family transcriptional regulator [Sinorhizobium meliloti]
MVERDLCVQLAVGRTMVPEVLRHLESESLVANLPKGPIVSRLDLNEAKQIDQIRVAVGGRATVRGAARPAIVEALEASFKGIRECYASRLRRAPAT